MESNLIVEYLNYINEAYCSCVYVLSMEGRRNMWSPWYLMLKDKLRKVECNFVAMLFHTTKIKCSSIWAINMMAMGELEFQCV